MQPQEIRHALYQGRSTKLIEKMAKTEEFLSATQKKIATERMLDREYALRFIAFTEIDYKAMYKGNIDNYLITTMKIVNNIDDEKEEQILYSFRRIMSYCLAIFGDLAFRRYTELPSGKYRRGPINKALFELWSICFRDMSDRDLNRLVSKKEHFIKAFSENMTDNNFLNLLKAGDAPSLVKRVNIANNFLERYLND